MNKYCLDSNCFILLTNFYRRKTFPLIWDKLDPMIENGLIVSPTEVYFEIAERGDEISQWVKDKKEKIFVELDEQQIVAATGILSKYRRLHDIKKTKFDADPLVVALAYSYKFIVVSNEKKTNIDNGRQNIANVCGAYNISCITLLDFFDEIGINEKTEQA